MFGSWSGLIFQFAVTAVVVLGLIAVVYWLVRRYSSGGLGRIGRGRVPRLAVVDAVAIDGRRKLVLVRRDSIEHLILIGGPTDVVVEQAIQRPRARPMAKPANGAMAATGGEAPAEQPAEPENPPIPFPQIRVQPPAPPPPPAQPVAHQPAGQGIERPFLPARRVAQAQSAPRGEPPPAPAMRSFEPMPAVAQNAEAARSADALPAFLRPADENNGQSVDLGAALSIATPIATPPTPPPAPHPPASDDTSIKVNDLEREMARLLGEITSNRPS